MVRHDKEVALRATTYRLSHDDPDAEHAKSEAREERGVPRQENPSPCPTSRQDDQKERDQRKKQQQSGD
jgi:hypothetical protein